MSETEKLLELAFKKVDEDNDFMAFVLKKYLETEKISEQELLSSLSCSLEDYYKLALCRVPKTDAQNFVERLNNISQYTHISTLELNKIIKRVDAILKFADSSNNNTLLMAARDKKNNEKKD
jgi:hypothetical protein